MRDRSEPRELVMGGPSEKGQPALELVFRALSNHRRREILEVLRARNTGLGIMELARSTDLERLTVAGHLSVLREAQLVSERREGRKRVHQVEPGGFDAILDYSLRFAEPN
jgi:DNA-binding transcriptional ArsR family regulator